MKDPLESVHFDSLLADAIALEEETAVPSYSIRPVFPTRTPTIAPLDFPVGMRVLFVATITMAILAMLRHSVSYPFLFPILLGGMHACNALLVSIEARFLSRLSVRGMIILGGTLLTSMVFTSFTANIVEGLWIWRAAVIAAPFFMAIAQRIVFGNRSYCSPILGGTWIAGTTWIYHHFFTLGTVPSLFFVVGYSVSLFAGFFASQIVESPELDKGIVLNREKIAAC